MTACPPSTATAAEELVLIGENLDAPGLEARLDTCLLTDAELAAGPEAWAAYPDPFPDWGDAFGDDHDHDHAHDHDHDHGDDACDCGHAH